MGLSVRKYPSCQLQLSKIGGSQSLQTKNLSQSNLVCNFDDWCNLAKLWYFTNLDFLEIRGFPFLTYLLGAQVVWGRYNLTKCNVYMYEDAISKRSSSQKHNWPQVIQVVTWLSPDRWRSLRVTFSLTIPIRSPADLPGGLYFCCCRWPAG